MSEDQFVQGIAVLFLRVTCSLTEGYQPAWGLHCVLSWGYDLGSCPIFTLIVLFSWSPSPSHILNHIYFLDILRYILQVLCGMLQFTYSWMHRRLKDLWGCPSSDSWKDKLLWKQTLTVCLLLFPECSNDIWGHCLWCQPFFVFSDSHFFTKRETRLHRPF